MDCTIPSHNIKTFCSAVASMSRIGKDLYVEFDPLEGLVLRTLNDAKSAFCVFTYKPSFFERCSAPPVRKRHLGGDDEDVYKCRVPLRAMAAVTKPRPKAVSLRIRNEASSNHLFLSFEFHIEKHNNLLRIVHRLGVADADGVTAVASRANASELTADPRALLRMMEPLKNHSTEVALRVNDKAKMVTMASFHHEQNFAQDGNALLQNKSASILKTETTVAAEEFEDFLFQPTHEDENEDIPPNVDTEVTLVYNMKEPKSFLQYLRTEENLRVTLYFHWGGKPLLMETKTPTFSGELVMGTLDYKLLRNPSSQRTS